NFFFFQAEDGIRDGHVTGVQSVLFRSIYDYSQTISQFTTSWAFVADYSLDFWGALAGSIFGYQGCRWHGNYLYLTIHENGFPDDLYMHVYLWTGTGFYQYQKIRSPSPNS